MNEILAGAIIAVCHLDDAAAVQWFGSVLAALTAEDSGSDQWAVVRERLIQQAESDAVPATTVAAFLDYLDAFAPNPLAVVDGLAELMSRGVLLDAYYELSAAASAAETRDHDAPD